MELPRNLSEEQLKAHVEGNFPRHLKGQPLVKIERPSLPIPKHLTAHQAARLVHARAIRAASKPNWYASKHSNVGMWNGGKTLGCGRKARRACGA